MKFQKSFLILIPAAFAVMVFACNKDTGLPSFADSCTEGLNGNITIKFKEAHHNKTIPSLPNYPDSLFIKFNTSEFPGDDASQYDLVLAGTAPDSVIIVNNLSCGRYYVFMTGWDSGIVQRVKGGIPLTIPEEASNLDITVPVTED